MRKSLFLLGGLTALALAAGLAGCKDKDATESTTGGGTAPGPGKSSNAGAPAGAPKFKIITNGISPFWNSMGKGLDNAKAELKVDADWVGPNPADHNAQVKLVNEAIAAKVDGIAVSAIEADALAPRIDEAVNAGIPVITFDSDSPKSKRSAYIGTNNFEAGRIAGEETVKLFPNGGKLIAFVGNMGAQNARDRYEGFKSAIKGHNIEFIADPFQDNKDKSRARSNVSDAITKFGGQVNGFVGLYSYNGPAIVAAVQAAGIRDKVKIICFDGEPDTLVNLGKGLVDVTVVQKPYEFGRLSVKLLNLLKKDKTYDAAIKELTPELNTLGMKVNGNVIDTGVEVVTPQNAKPFLDKLKERGLEST